MDQISLKLFLEYNPSTGLFIWLIGKRKGSVAGTLRTDGYVQINIKGVCYFAHRLAHLYMEGNRPNQIDHRNEIRNDNRWSNLREATHSQNKMHTARQINNTTGYKGVTYDARREKYWAQIKKDNVPYFLGYYDLPEEAYAVYVEAAKQLHGEFAYV